MPTSKTVSFSAQPNDYSIELEDIQRRQALAQALQEQGMQGTGGTEMVGGWAIPKSPMEGFGKAAQQASGAYQQKALTERERQIGQDQRTALADELRRMNSADMGNPGSPSPPDSIGGGPPMAPTAPDRSAATNIALSSQNPMLQQLGMQRYTQDAQRQALIAALRGDGAPQAGGAQPGAPTQAAGGQSGQVGGPAGGVPMAAWLQADPTGAKYMEQLAKERAPVNVRPGGTVYIPGQGPQFTAPQNGMQTNWNGGQAQTGVVPGAIPAMAAITGAQTTAKAGAEAPYSMAQMDVPVYLPGGDQVNVKMNALQAHQYQTTGQLPPEVAASIPGLQQPGAPMPQGQPPMPPQPPGIVQPPVPGGYAGMQQTQPVRNAQSANIQQQEAQPNGGNLLAANTVVPSAPPPSSAARPVVGRTQSNTEQVTQKRQQAGGNTADETYAKDYVAFVNGGAQDATKQLSQLQDVVTQLSDPNAKLSGPFIGSTPDALLKFNKTGQNAIAMRERVEEVVQRSLRAILGAQFTEKEGERLIARAYNPNLPEKENAVRVGRLFTQLQQSLAAKQDAANYFQKNNTLQGWQGKLPTMGDFEPARGATSGWDGQQERRAPAGGSAVKWDSL